MKDRIKRFNLLEVQRVYELQPRKKRLFELVQCPPTCRFRGSNRCTVDNCPILEQKYASLIRKTLAQVTDTKPKQKRLVGVRSREKAMLYHGIFPRGIDRGIPDEPIYDSIVGDKEVWAIPWKDDNGEFWVSHRVRIYGVRAGRRRSLVVVEVYVPRWKLCHINCEEHKLRMVKRKRWKCPTCGRKPDIMIRRGTWKCSNCGEIIKSKNRFWDWNHVCPACRNKEKARRLAWDWFVKEKLAEGGINYVYLPYESFDFKVVELTRSNSRSIGRIWL